MLSYFHYCICGQRVNTFCVEKSKCHGEGEGQGSPFPLNQDIRDFPGSPVGKNPSANAGDMCSVPDAERFHMRGNS